MKPWLYLKCLWIIKLIVALKNCQTKIQYCDDKMALTGAINFLDNKGCICMLLNLKMRHKPNVNCWSSRLYKIATIVIIIAIISDPKFWFGGRNCFCAKILPIFIIAKEHKSYNPMISWVGVIIIIIIISIIIIIIMLICHVFRSWTSTMSWGQKLPTEKNLVSQRYERRCW